MKGNSISETTSYNPIRVILIEEEAFYKLIECVMDRFKKKDNDKWLSPSEAMQLLNIKSKSTLAELRYQGKIRYTQPQKKIILYDRASLLEYLESYSKNKF